MKEQKKEEKRNNFLDVKKNKKTTLKSFFY